jgi:hypothetical protein
MDEPWPTCGRCLHPGPHIVEKVLNIHLYAMRCSLCQTHMKWLGHAGVDWLARLGMAAVLT